MADQIANINRRRESVTMSVARGEREDIAYSL